MKILLYISWLCAFPTIGLSQTDRDSCRFYVPNSLTPDCENAGCELLTVNSTCPFQDFSLTIYNRWGNKIFETTDPKKQFDCTPFPEGSYFWKLQATFDNRQKVDQTGFITILK